MPENTRYQHLLLHDSGSIPGIPGAHGRGSYVIDWQERTITPASSLESYLSFLAQPDEETTIQDAPETHGDGQETAQLESAAITGDTPSAPQEQAVSDAEATPESAPDTDAPIAVGGLVPLGTIALVGEAGTESTSYPSPAPESGA